MRIAELEVKELAKAKNTAYRILTYRPRSIKELETKLREKEYSDCIIAAVIDHCTRLGYLDDARFAMQWAASRVRYRSLGKRRIEQELKLKGIDRLVIQQALQEAIPEQDERDAARNAAEKKLRTMTSIDPQARKRRLAGFLERKGFTPDIIWSLLNEVR